MKNYDALKDRVAHAIEYIGDTNNNFAENLGVNKNTITSYRAKRGDVKGRALVGLSVFYKIRPDWLLLGRGPMIAGEAAEEGQDTRSIDIDIEAERTRLHLAAKKAELEYLRRIKPDDDPEASMKQLEFIGQMVERFRSFQKSLDKEATQ